MSELENVFSLINDQSIIQVAAVSYRVIQID